MVKKYEKIIFMIILILNAVQNSTFTAASELHDNSGILLSAYFDNNFFDKTYVTRGDCVKALARMMGANDGVAYERMNGFYYTPPYQDYDFGKDVVFGYFILGQFQYIYGDGMYAYPYRDIMVKEIAAFCTRILNYDDQTLEDSYKTAKQMGLIWEQDSFYSEDGTKNVTPEEFLTIFNRMLGFKRSKYYEMNYLEAEDRGVCRLQTDETGEMTYMQWQKLKLQYRDEKAEEYFQKFIPHTES